MKLRLPLSLLAIISVFCPAFTAPISDVITGDVTATDSQTLTTLTIGETTSDAYGQYASASGNLTIDLDNNTLQTGKFLLHGDNDFPGTVVMKSGTVVITGSAREQFWVGYTNNYAGSENNAVMTMEGGTIDAAGAFLQLGQWSTGGTFHMKGGHLKVSGIEFARPDKSILIVDGGRIDVGSNGIILAENAANSNKVIVTNGIVGCTANWGTSSNLKFDTGDEDGGRFSIDIASSSNFINWNSPFIGTGTGTLVKTGNGLLRLRSTTDSTTARTWEIEGGTLLVINENSLGVSSDPIRVTGDIKFACQNAEFGKDFHVADDGVLYLYARNVDDTSTSTVTKYTGNITFEEGGSLRLEQVNVILSGGAARTGDKFSLQSGALMTIENTSLTFNTALSEGDLCIGAYARGSAAPDIVSILTINSGGLLHTPNANLRLSMMHDAAVVNINEGGEARLKGINFAGYDATVNINGGTLAIGEGGIPISNDGANRTAERIGKINLNYGRLHFTDDSFVRFTVPTGSFTDENVIILSGVSNEGRIIEVDPGKTASIEVTIAGNRELIKEGLGTLAINAPATYSGQTTVREGTLEIGADGSLSSSVLEVYNGAAVTGGWIASGQFGGSVVIKGAPSAIPAHWDAPMTVSLLTLDSSSARLNVSGDLNLNGNIVFNIDHTSPSMGPLVTLSGTNVVTLDSSGKIILNAANAALEDVGEGVIHLQLFNETALAGLTGFDTGNDLVWNRTDEKFVFQADNFLSTGTVSWYNSTLSMELLTPSQGNSSDPYSPMDSTIYVGARSDGTVFNINKPYISPDGNTRLTNGYGNFIFQPSIADTGVLYVLGMKGGDGKVWISNNDNAQQRTDITDVTLVVDSTRGASVVLPGSAPVGILGKGAVHLYGSSTENGVLELRTGGDTDRGDGTYIITNTLVLNENTIIRQTGANTHTLTGPINLGYAAYATISNESERDFIIQTFIEGDTGSSLQFNGNQGRIVLDGGDSSPFARAAANSFSAGQLNIGGSSGLLITNGYTVTADKINIASESTLALQNGAILNLGPGGMTDGAAFIAGDATINPQGNTAIDTLMTLTGNTVIDTQAGENLTLSRGVTGQGNLSKTGAGKLIIGKHEPSTTGTIILHEGVLQLGLTTGTYLADGVTPLTAGFTLAGQLDILSGTLSGAIDAGGQDINFGANSVFSLGVDNTYHTSYIQNANDVHVESGAILLVDVLEIGWTVATDYYIISANSAITGDPFELAVDGEFAFVDVHMAQTEKNVKLTLSAKVPEATLHTANQHAVYPVIANLAFQALDGKRGGLRGELLEMMQIVSKMKSDQLEPFIAETALSTASLYTALAGQVTNTSQHVKSVRNRVTQLDPSLFDQYQDTYNRTVWVEGVSHYADLDSDANAPGYRLDTWGINLGTSFSAGPAMLYGVGFGYMSGETKVKGSYGESTTESYNMDLFARYKKEQFSLTGIVSGGFSHVDYKRYLTFDGNRLRADGKSNGSQVMGMLEAAYDFTLNDSGTSIIQPLVNASIGYARFKGFDEKGDMGNAGYHVNAQQITPTTLSAGARYIYSRQERDSYIPLRGELRAVVAQDVGDVTYDIQANYLGAPDQRMDVTGVAIKRTAFIIGASGTLPVGLYTSFFADVSAEFRSNQNSVTASAGINFQF